MRVAAAEDGRFEVVELYLDPEPRPVSTEDLRRVPIGRIEAWANSARGRANIEQNATGQAISIVAYAEEIRRLSEAPLEKPPSRRPSAALVLGNTPNDRGDKFYQQVAHVYLGLVEHGVAPAPLIAMTNDVPVTTARRWIKEARRRGFLGPGRKGKAG